MSKERGADGVPGASTATFDRVLTRAPCGTAREARWDARHCSGVWPPHPPSYSGARYTKHRQHDDSENYDTATGRQSGRPGSGPNSKRRLEWLPIVRWQSEAVRGRRKAWFNVPADALQKGGPAHTPGAACESVQRRCRPASQSAGLLSTRTTDTTV
ncbi:unnamed protein product [Ixodes pacificus]